MTCIPLQYSSCLMVTYDSLLEVTFDQGGPIQLPQRALDEMLARKFAVPLDVAASRYAMTEAGYAIIGEKSAYRQPKPFTVVLVPE